MFRFAALALLLSACAEDVAKDKAQATVTEPPPAAAPVAAPAPTPASAAGELHVDAARSSIHALGAKITKQHDIVFPSFDGTVRLDGENVAAVAFTVQVGALQVEPEKLQNHLKSADFFGVDQFPTATFTSATITAKPGDGVTHEIAGDLTVHGTTKRISFPAKLEVTPGEVAGHAEFAINRKDFGIVFPGMPDDLIKDNVLLTVSLVAPRAPATAAP
jgi:polyisoprenoid-binding protein YceI